MSLHDIIEASTYLSGCHLSHENNLATDEEEEELERFILDSHNQNQSLPQRNMNALHSYSGKQP